MSVNELQHVGTGDEPLRVHGRISEVNSCLPGGSNFLDNPSSFEPRPRKKLLPPERIPQQNPQPDPLPDPVVVPPPVPFSSSPRHVCDRRGNKVIKSAVV